MRSSLEEQAERVAGLLKAVGAVDGTAPVVVRRFGTGDAWLLRRGSELLVLKRGRPEQDEADVEWEHGFLHRLARTDFAASVPVPAFNGRSWTWQDGRVWATLGYLPGRSLASEDSPNFVAAGAFLARYHRAARSVLVRGQRPTEPGLSPLRTVTPSDRLRGALGSDDALDRFARLLDDLEAGLGALGYDALEQLVIHGDPTNDNLIVDGAPARLVGLIDFGSAHRAPWPADIAAALWRSARLDPAAVPYDPDRSGRFVAGYHGETPLPIDLARAIPLLMQGRGLQLISRRARRLPAGQPAAAIPDVALTLHRAEWLHAHRPELTAAIAGAVS
jgi:Ser/Thr protein kinase RdoA (MazF antagonist)